MSMRQIASQEIRIHKFAAKELPLALLPAHIAERPAVPANVAGDVDALLVTGGTGFIGGAVLAELIDTALWPRVLMMVRARDVDEGRRRIVDSISRFFPGRDMREYIHPDQIIVAGLEDAASLADEPRLRQVTHVIHSAAVTSFAKHPRIHVINVDASEAFVRVLMENAKVERFLNVGTAWCVGMGGGAVIREGGNQETDKHVVPYTRSKIDFERLIRSKHPAFPLISARPSIVVGHSKFGTVPSGSIYWVYRAAQLLGSFACRFDDKQDVVPADWVARALVHLTLKPELWHDVYHLSAGHGASSTIADLDVAIAEGRQVAPHGRHGFRTIGARDLPRAVYERRQLFEGVNPVLLAKALSIYAHFAESGVVFDNARTLGEGVPPPPPFHTYARECARTSEIASIAAQMEDDFK